MGLYAEFHLDDFGYETELSVDFGGQTLVENIDYSDAFQACMDTFMEIATSLVPIDTGYLHDSIGVEFLGDGVAFYANAEYAQYVEFGTSRMGAQEYFAPALEEAMAIFHQEAEIATSFAEDAMEGVLQGLMDASMGLAHSMGGGFFTGLGIFAVSAFIFFPVLLFMYGVFDSIGHAFFGEGVRAEISGMGSDGVPEIEIT